MQRRGRLLAEDPDRVRSGLLREAERISSDVGKTIGVLRDEIIDGRWKSESYRERACFHHARAPGATATPSTVRSRESSEKSPDARLLYCISRFE